MSTETRKSPRRRETMTGLVDFMQNFCICRKKKKKGSLQIKTGVNDSIYLGNSEQVWIKTLKSFLNQEIPRGEKLPNSVQIHLPFWGGWQIWNARLKPLDMTFWNPNPVPLSLRSAMCNASVPRGLLTTVSAGWEGLIPPVPSTLKIWSPGSLLRSLYCLFAGTVLKRSSARIIKKMVCALTVSSVIPRLRQRNSSP